MNPGNYAVMGSELPVAAFLLLGGIVPRLVEVEAYMRDL